ncbi:hypothetical protein HZC30_03915 [Candidatus Woesearchaeota archaeon]|nr:hypothetical protein [Candidatus Woesearchaeota archaeon]
MEKVKLSGKGAWYVIIPVGVIALALILWSMGDNNTLNHSNGEKMRYTFPFAALWLVLVIGIVISCCLRHFREGKKLPQARAGFKTASKKK